MQAEFDAVVPVVGGDYWEMAESNLNPESAGAAGEQQHAELIEMTIGIVVLVVVSNGFVGKAAVGESAVNKIAVDWNELEYNIADSLNPSPAQILL